LVVILGLSPTARAQPLPESVALWQAYNEALERNDPAAALALFADDGMYHSGAPGRADPDALCTVPCQGNGAIAPEIVRQAALPRRATRFFATVARDGRSAVAEVVVTQPTGEFSVCRRIESRAGRITFLGDAPDGACLTPFGSGVVAASSPVAVWLRWLGALDRGDVAAALALLTDDATLTNPFDGGSLCAQPCRGTAAIRAELERASVQHTPSVLDPASVQVSGPMVTGVVVHDGTTRRFAGVVVQRDRIVEVCGFKCRLGPAPSSANFQILERWLTARNQGDIQGALDVLTPDAYLETSGGLCDRRCIDPTTIQQELERQRVEHTQLSLDPNSVREFGRILTVTVEETSDAGRTSGVLWVELRGDRIAAACPVACQSPAAAAPAPDAPVARMSAQAEAPGGWANLRLARGMLLVLGVIGAVLLGWVVIDLVRRTHGTRT
jgi:ketosteroid isomerase-like protein